MEFDEKVKNVPDFVQKMKAQKGKIFRIDL